MIEELLEKALQRGLKMNINEEKIMTNSNVKHSIIVDGSVIEQAEMSIQGVS